jgi:hypothetical protein
MKKIHILSFSLIYILLFSSCFKNEEIIGDLEEPRFHLPTGDSEIDQYIRNYYNKYNSYLLYDYAELDYTWSVTQILSLTLIKQTNEDLLFEGTKYLEKTWGDYYTDEFKKDFFPYKIFLADSVISSSLSMGDKDEVCYPNINTLCVGLIREGIESLTPDSLLYIRGEINATFWGKYLYKNNYVTVADNFFKISGDENYDSNLRNNPENEGVPADEIDLKTYGFWVREEGPSSYYVMSPNYTQDVYRFVFEITTHTKEEMDAKMEGYPKLIEKYKVLINHFKEHYGVDLQAIGDAAIISE